MKKVFWAFSFVCFTVPAVIQAGYGLGAWSDPHLNSGIIVGAFVVAAVYSVDSFFE